MVLRYGSYSKKGHKNSKLSLRRSEYYQYKFKDISIYIKKKYYTSAYDGDIKTEIIKENTFKRAIKRGEYTKIIDISNSCDVKNIPQIVLEYKKKNSPSSAKE